MPEREPGQKGYLMKPRSRFLTDATFDLLVTYYAVMVAVAIILTLP
jgi:hypothetical protein